MVLGMKSPNDLILCRISFAKHQPSIDSFKRTVAYFTHDMGKDAILREVLCNWCCVRVVRLRWRYVIRHRVLTDPGVARGDPTESKVTRGFTQVEETGVVNMNKISGVQWSCTESRSCNSWGWASKRSSVAWTDIKLKTWCSWTGGIRCDHNFTHFQVKGRGDPNSAYQTILKGVKTRREKRALVKYRLIKTGQRVRQLSSLKTRYWRQSQ